MIEETFGLSGAPFRLNTDVRFYYESEAHRRAMAHLRYGLRLGEGFVVVTGEAGVGKTMLVEQLLLDLEGTDVIAVAMQPASLTPETLVPRVLAAFGRNAGGGDPADALRDVLVMERERGAKASLIIDEAQHLSDDVLEALRLLLNMSHEGEALLQVCLLGQTGLRRVLFRPDMEQFRQRVVASHHLPALNAGDTAAYIRHRMRRAGRPEGEEVFTEDACVAVFEATGGVPRRINTLCAQALTQAALDGAAVIDADLVASVLREGSGEASEPAAESPASGRDEAAGPGPGPALPIRPANDDEEAAAERALALVTARTEGAAEGAAEGVTGDRPLDAPTTPVPAAAEDGDPGAGGRTAAARVEGGGEGGAEASPDTGPGPGPARYAAPLTDGVGPGRYPISVGEINAAIRSIQEGETPERGRAAPRPQAPEAAQTSPPASRPEGADTGQGTPEPRPPRRRFRSPQELMMAKARSASAPSAAEPPGPAPEPDREDTRVSAPEQPSPDAGDTQAGPPVDRAALGAFLAEVGPALEDLRATLAALRERTDALDAARRARRERLAAGADAAAERLAKLRGE